MRLTKTLSQKEVEVRSIISKENEKNQQNRIAESAKLMANIEEVRKALQEKLDAITDKLTDHGDLQRRQDRNLEALEGHIKEYNIALSEIHASVEDCTASITSMVASMETMRNEARDPNMMQGTEKWLGRFSSQLVASGITSAMTAAVVMIATRSEGSRSEERPNSGTVSPQFNRPHNAGEPDSQPPQTAIIPSDTAAEDQTTFERPLQVATQKVSPSASRNDTPLIRKTAGKFLPWMSSPQDGYRYSEDSKQDPSNLSPSTQDLSERLSLARDQKNQSIKMTSIFNPTTAPISNPRSPGQSSQSYTNKTAISNSTSASSNHTSSYLNTPNHHPHTPSSLHSRQSYSPEMSDENDSILTSSNSTMSYSSQHRYFNQSNTNNTIEAVPVTWVWICCQCNWMGNVETLMLFEKCPSCHHIRDHNCIVKESVRGSSSSCNARTCRR